MANTDGRFNPAYSTIQAIYLGSLNITRQNSECVFDKLELVENINDLVPSGGILVKDFKDIVSYIKVNEIDKVKIVFFNGTTWILDITGVSYINNAASDTEENFVMIYLSNRYYKLMQKSSLTKSLEIQKPQVYLIHDFINLLKEKVFATTNGIVDNATNYVLYRPLNTLHDRQEAVSDNALEYLNYLASAAVGDIHSGFEYGTPQFMFWTDLDGSVNFKYLHRNPEDDPNFGSRVYIGIYNGDSVVQKLSDGNVYRKAYYYNTNPAFQFISKNYYYIKKTPKILDSIPPNLSEAGEKNYNTQCLTYQFQDEGQRFNIEIVDSEGLNEAIPGSYQLIYDKHWGYYEGLDTINNVSYYAHIGQDFGTQKAYSELNLMGIDGYMPFVDNTEMWKNMFDMTEVHPNYPDSRDFGENPPGPDTYLQKIMNIRYDKFTEIINDINLRTEKIRDIELQNFIMYSLCCMGQKNQEDCFFAALTRYEEDINCPEGTDVGKKYRYAWNKLKFEGTTGACGGIQGECGGSGASCGIQYFYQMEKWVYDSLKSSSTQDDTWAINLNERGLTAGYIPAGYISSCAPTNFNLRPIGSKSETVEAAEDIFHIVKICKYVENNNILYYFDAQNAFDGCCSVAAPTTIEGSGGP